MNIKTYIAIAVAALTAACNEVPQEESVAIPVDEAAAASVELNDDGSVKTDETK